MSTKPREQMTPAEVAGAQAASMERFYSEIRPDLRCTANTHLIREWAKNNMPEPVLTNVGEIEWVASQLEGSLAVIKPRQEFVPLAPSVPQLTYEEKVAEFQSKMRTADPASLRKVALVTALRNSGYNAEQISVELQSRKFKPLTSEERELLAPPQQTEDDVRTVQQNAEDEVAAACKRIGELLNRGPVSRAELIALPNDVFRKLLWPAGPGTRKNVETEKLIDVVLQGGSR